jgi:hypothetical protein
MYAEYKTCEAVLKALRAGRNQQEIARFLKRAQVPDLPFEESFEPKPDCWVGRCHSCPKFKKNIFGLRFCGLATQNTAKITQGWLKANLKDPWSKEIWPPSSKLTQKGLLA